MNGQFMRLGRLIGEENVRSLFSRSVAVCGIGAVGGHALETLARCGIGHIKVVDFDTIEESNINRQILALHSTIGELKTDAAERRVMDINPECIIDKHPVVISSDNLGIFSSADIILDCIDSVGAKIGLLAYAYELVDASVRRYLERGFTSLSVSFGCTGGQHRSVYAAQHMAEHLHKTFGIQVNLTHREQHIEQTFYAKY